MNVSCAAVTNAACLNWRIINRLVRVKAQQREEKTCQSGKDNQNMLCCYSSCPHFKPAVIHLYLLLSSLIHIYWQKKKKLCIFDLTIFPTG